MTEQLWAPWRLKYIEADKADEGCIFCLFPAQDKSHDAENLIVHRGEHAFVMLNAYPYSNGHLMVVPYQHTSQFDTLGNDELLEIMQLTNLTLSALKIAFKPDGFNLGVNMGRVAGAGIADHLHWHIVPRWNGDTNFMPVFADVRVIPESLSVTRERLVAAFQTVLERTGHTTGKKGEQDSKPD